MEAIKFVNFEFYSGEIVIFEFGLLYGILDR